VQKGNTFAVQVRRSFAVGVAVLAAGCAAPSEPTKQAAEVASVAAEGALLAHDAAEGDTFRSFTRVHAKALEERLAQLEPKTDDGQVAALLARVAGALERLADDPGDRERAAMLEHELEAAANDAEQLAR
jgi:hypothetical protein